MLDAKTLFSNIMAAHVALRPRVRVTPLDHSRRLSELFGSTVLLKCEQVQPTGSFKIRGASNKIRVLSNLERTQGVITASTGNHGLAVAKAALLAGVAAMVYVPRSAAQMKKDAIRALGADLVEIEGEPVDAELQARYRAAAEGKVYISPYNDLDVVAGQGTLGAELAAQDASLDAVFIAVGGGGLIGGAGLALKRLSPSTRIVGVWPEHSTAMLRSIEAGRIVAVDQRPTLSDGTAGAVEPGSVTFPICRSVIDETVVVSEAEIKAAMRMLAIEERWMIEGAAGAALAGFIKVAKAYRSRRVAIVLCGRNISLSAFLAAIAEDSHHGISAAAGARACSCANDALVSAPVRHASNAIRM